HPSTTVALLRMPARSPPPGSATRPTLTRHAPTLPPRLLGTAPRPPGATAPFGRAGCRPGLWHARCACAPRGGTTMRWADCGEVQDGDTQREGVPRGGGAPGCQRTLQGAGTIVVLGRALGSRARSLRRAGVRPSAHDRADGSRAAGGVPGAGAGAAAAAASAPAAAEGGAPAHVGGRVSRGGGSADPQAARPPC